jgi:formate hydrogenlyase transcriptional activator
MNDDTEILVAPAIATRYESLSRVFQEIGLHSDPKELFAALASELHRVVPFDYIGVFLRHQDSNTFLDRCIDMEDLSDLVPDETLPPDDRPMSWVFEHQQPLMTWTDRIDPRHERLRAILNGYGVRVICTLPLTTAQHKLGAISFGSKHSGTYSPEEVRFLSLVADGIALAFDNALNFAALRCASEELRSKNERLQLLLELTNRLVSNLELRDLLREICASIRRVMHCEGVGITLPDPDTGQLRLYAFDYPGGKGPAREGMLISADDAGSLFKAFRTGQPVSVARVESTVDPLAIADGLTSVYHLPLISREHVLGVLGLGSSKENAFADDDVAFVGQVASQVALALDNALAYGQIRDLNDRLSQEKLYLEDEIRTEMNFAQIIGDGAALRRVLTRVETVAPTDSTVLIDGETGTGKELIARAIHDLSPRRSKAFVKLNCAAIPTGLLESELFGHERGAFTGAIAQRIGRFEVANGGTIFLDEIGEIPLELQTKLLRVLQEREFERLGSSRTLRTDARLIAATNRDLEAMVREQKFRSDLFFRVNVFPIHVPPLRERPEDIPLLVRHFAQQFSRRMNKSLKTIPSATMDALRQYHWPGNIRELQNVVERAVILSGGTALAVDVADLKSLKAGSASETPAAAKGSTTRSIRKVLDETERQQILEALEQCNWVVGGPKGAAAVLGMKRPTLQLRMQKLGITRHHS